MRLRRPATEDERLFSSVILVLIVYLVLNSLIYTVVESGDSLLLHYLTTLSFLGGIVSGVLFFLWTRPAGGRAGKDPLTILERVLNPDEIQIIHMVKGAEGMTQDSIRLRTGFSKSKVSILVSDLEKSGVLAREKMGRTYKLYLGEWLR